MTTRPRVRRLESGVPNFDALCGGGLPTGSVTVVAGPPGSGKTIFTQQLCFHNASPKQRIIYFSTLSEPTAKTLRYLGQLSYFKPGLLDGAIEFVDLGMIMRGKGLAEATASVMSHVKKVKPAIVVIDSFRVFDDLSASKEELRKFGYELTVNLMAWEITTFLLGEFSPHDIATNPLFSIVDALIMMTQREQAGEQLRFMQVVKMRGTAHSRDEHTFRITGDGIEIFAPRVTIRRDDLVPDEPRCLTGITGLDELLGDGIPRGSSVLVSGVAGTGKTLLSMEFVYRGALAGERGIIFSFEETEARLRATARTLGWDLDGEIERGMIELIFIPQPEIEVEAHLLMMRERVDAFAARRVAVDSLSVFLHKVRDERLAREKTFQLASVIQNTGAVGFFATDIPYGSNKISRFGVEETVVDGILLLTSTEEGFERQRYVECYKLRNTRHLKGRHSMNIGQGGLTVFPRYETQMQLAEPPPSIVITNRLPSGVPGLDELIGGGLLERSVSLVSGSAGVGKSTLAFQFLAAGAARGDRGLYVAMEEGPQQIADIAASLGLLDPATSPDLIDAVYVARDRIRPNQLLALLTERVRSGDIRRIVLDSVSHLAGEGITDDGLRQLVYALIVRFKTLGATTLLTLETPVLHDLGSASDQRFSALSDNLFALRYADRNGRLQPTLTVIKTRGSEHDFGTFHVSIGRGGLRVGPTRSM